MKRIIVLLICAAFALTMLAACSCAGDNSDKKSSASSKNSVSETTKVLETTADGGTVEKDKDENKITMDKDGGIISVEDKNGNAVDVDEYISDHPQYKKSASAGTKSSDKTKTSSSKKSSSSTKSSDKNKKSSASKSSSSKSSGSKSSNSKSSSKNNDVEEEIPTIIVDDEGIETAPELPDL